MRKRLLCALAALALLALGSMAQASGGLTGAPASATDLATATPVATPEATPTATPAPTPTATPAGTLCERDGVRIALPAGMTVLEGAALAGYEAAVQADFPGTAETILAATDEARGAVALLAGLDSDADCLDAAREAAQALLGDAAAASEQSFGENRCALFSCAVEGKPYHLYYFSNGERLLVAGFSGLETAEIEAALTELEF